MHTCVGLIAEFSEQEMVFGNRSMLYARSGESEMAAEIMQAIKRLILSSPVARCSNPSTPYGRLEDIFGGWS